MCLIRERRFDVQPAVLDENVAPHVTGSDHVVRESHVETGANKELTLAAGTTLLGSPRCCMPSRKAMGAA